MKDIAASVKGRLQNKARELGRPFNEVLQYYAIERLLYRLSQSPYVEQFVLKGALLFFGWKLITIRPTRDIDFRGYIQNSADAVEMVFREICASPVAPDGMVFEPSSIRSEIIRGEDEYHGMRVYFQTMLGTAKLPMATTFETRQTILPDGVPDGFTPQYILPNRIHWKAFLKRISADTTLDLEEVVERLKIFLLPSLRAIQTGLPFETKWKKGGDWVYPKNTAGET